MTCLTSSSLENTSENENCFSNIFSKNPSKARDNIIGAILILVGIVFWGLVWWFVYTQNKHEQNTLEGMFCVPQFSINSFSASTFDVKNNSEISADWKIAFSVSNMCKASYSYNDTEVSVSFKDQLISVTSPGSFGQAAKNTTSLRAIFSASPVKVESWVAIAINSYRSLKELMPFNVIFSARVTASYDKSLEEFIDNYCCKDLMVNFTSNNTAESVKQVKCITEREIYL